MTCRNYALAFALITVFAVAAGAQYSIGFLVGASPGDRFGYALAAVGDQDGDGVADFVVGAPDEVGVGAAHVYSGATRALIRTLSIGIGVDFGHAVAPAGDIDGDGVTDVVVGDPTGPLAVLDTGIVTVFSGATGAVLVSATDSVLGSRFGWSVAGLGDVNGDGVGDIIVGAPYADPVGLPDAGRLFAISGQTGLPLWIADGVIGNRLLGAVVANVGDLDGDGIADVAAGAPGPVALDGPDALVAAVFDGQVLAFSGATGAPLWTYQLAGTGSAFGWSVAAPGDVNGDGVPDVAVGARHHLAGPYLAIVSGNGSGVLVSHFSPLSGPSSFGASLAVVGDVNNDGLPDLAIGVPVAPSTPIPNDQSGSVFLYLGGSMTPGVAGVPVVTPDPGFGAAQGRSIAGVGDLDGDGVIDLALGAPSLDGTGPGQVRFVGLGAAPLTIQAVGGTNQITTLGMPYASPVTFRVTDAAGLAVAGQSVRFSVAGGAPSITTALTDALGQVTVNATPGPNFVTTTDVTARTDGAPLLGAAVSLRVRSLRVLTTMFGAVVVFYNGLPGVPFILAADAPLPSPGVFPTVHGSVYTSIASPGPSFAALDGLGLFGPPDPALFAAPGYQRLFSFSPAAFAGSTFVFQVYGLDFSRPFPENVFASNPVTVTF